MNSSHTHPFDASLALCMGLHCRLGKQTAVHSLDSDVLKEVTEIYMKWFWTRPWSSSEAALCESMWLRGKDCIALSREFCRCQYIDSISFDSHLVTSFANRKESDVRKLLDIYDTTIPESKLREFDREVTRGFIICDVEV
jgi:hypothetical protein